MSPWGIVLRGFLAVLLGIILVVWPGATLSVILILFPIFVIIDGIGAIIIGSKLEKEGRFYSFIPMGIIEILIGIFVWIWPGITVTVFILLMALWAFILGLGEFFVAVLAKELKSSTRVLYTIGGILTFILGIIFIVYPLNTSVLVIWLTGIYFLVYGVLVGVAGLVMAGKNPKEKPKAVA